MSPEEISPRGRRIRQFEHYIAMMEHRTLNLAKSDCFLMFSVPMPPELRKQLSSETRFVQFAFTDYGFYLDLPDNTLTPNEARIVAARPEFGFALENPQKRLGERQSDPVQRQYVYAEQRAAAEDAAYVFFDLWKTSPDAAIDVTAAEFEGNFEWEQSFSMGSISHHPTRSLTALDLLRLYLDLRRLAPDTSEWTEERFVKNPPVLYRLRQFLALCRAFGIDGNPDTFSQGAFIDHGAPGYSEVVDRFKEDIEEMFSEGVDAGQLPWFFSFVLQYRTKLDESLSFGFRTMEAGGLYYYALQKAGELNELIRDNLATVEDVLVVLIISEGKSFSVDKLSENYGYPDVDLFDLDVKWL